MGKGSGGGGRRGRAHRQRRRRGRPVGTRAGGGLFSLGNTGHSTIDKLVQTARLVALLAFVLMVVGLVVALRKSLTGGIVIIVTGAMVFAGLHCVIHRLRGWALATRNVPRDTGWADVLRAVTTAPPTDR
ncbi:Hypp5122 [Branchiostoma lanceolatum]|uniref:Hypp5122 protein n=1 Tax=Branchiostoma lanceolatum TaxID=7740 RepID=A0A8K0AFA7_BRALA|nr:Hypp5122 [Branchiostoma lanceolatum]